MKPFIKKRRTSARLITIVAIVYTLVLIFFIALTRPSEALGGEKKITEGYQGSERIKLVEKPVTPNSAVTAQTGWIGDKRINLRIIRKNEYTETRGWVDGKYVHTRETTKNENP